MTDEYEVTLVLEVTTTVTIPAEHSGVAFCSAHDRFIQGVETALAGDLEYIELIDHTITKNENKIH